ncbi:MAG: phosphate ABC transporter substrate-binding/OmpA family protein [Saprospiraceae bacterium]|nr:phosphate ABC transporter substrate-binding/OmpA family protein [Saprospiraceae bacterium]
MATKLTTFSKFLITLLILGAIVGIGWFIYNKTSVLDDFKEGSGGDRELNRAPGERLSDDEDVLTVQLVTWGGYAPGLYFNEGAEPTTRSRFYQDYGLKVRFVKNDDLGAALNAWIADEYDVLVQTADAFPLYTAPEDINAFNPKVFMQVDWSRGGDVIIAKRGINSINDLRGKRVAVTEPSPSQTLLISSLEAAGLSYDDIEVVAAQDPIFAAQAFKGNDVDAAVVWSPFHLEATRDVAGSKVLLSTIEQSHIIGDIMFAKDDFIRENREQIHAFYEGWMKAIAELHSTPSNQDKAAKLLAEFLEFPVEDAQGAMADVRWTTHGDNVNFFGLNPDYRGIKGDDLYSKMSRKFYELNQAPAVAPPWRSVAYTGAIQAAMDNLRGAAHAAEEGPAFDPPTEAERTAPAIASKPVSINFATGQSTLTENAKTIIDLQFADVARTFANMRVRIEGNTDNVGARQMNMQLSQRRAQAVADYLQQTYGMDPNRFVIIGNGPDKPVAGCEDNASEDCRARNRRTDFQLIPG